MPDVSVNKSLQLMYK